MIDGNRLNYKGTVEHLWGIDAPDIAHVCADGWDAGKAAAAYLRSLIGTKPVTCEPKASPMGGGPFAICKVDGQDLSAAMASAGMAWAAPNVSAGLQRDVCHQRRLCPSLRQGVGMARRHPDEAIAT